MIFSTSGYNTGQIKLISRETKTTVTIMHSYAEFCVGVVLKFEEIRVIEVNFDQWKRNLVRVSGFSNYSSSS